MKKKYSLFVGRWQVKPRLHKGHIALIESELKKGNPVCVAIRDTEKSEKNPYSIEERKKVIKRSLKKWGNMVNVIKIPDIRAVIFGRQVGYEIKEVRLSKELEAISATKIREKQNTNKLWK